MSGGQIVAIDLSGVLFPGTPVRTIFEEGQFWYHIVDCLSGCVRTPNPTRYWNDHRHSLIASDLDIYAAGVSIHPFYDAMGREFHAYAATIGPLIRIIISLPEPHARVQKQLIAERAVTGFLKA